MTSVDKKCAVPNGGVPSADPSHKESALSFELHTAASSVAIPTLRMVAADLAARADFDLDSIDDLRMAVDDVCAMLVRIAAHDADLSCRFTVRPERIEVAVAVDVDDAARPPHAGSFSWRILESLADDVSAVSLPAQPDRRRSQMCIILAKNAAPARQP